MLTRIGIMNYELTYQLTAFLNVYKFKLVEFRFSISTVLQKVPVLFIIKAIALFFDFELVSQNINKTKMKY